MKTYEANNVEELVNLTNKLKLKAHFSFLQTNDEVEFLGVKFGHQSDSNQKYDWLNKQFTIKFENQLYDLKVPTLIGRGIHYFRPRLEKKYNDGFLKIQSLSDAYKREIETQKYLNKSIYALVTPEKINNQIKNGVITVKEERTPLLDLIYHHDSEGLKSELKDTIEKTFEKLAEVHELNVIWGDAWLGNFLISNKEGLVPQGFSFTPNITELSFSTCFAKDFMSLFYSAIFRTNLPIDDIAQLAVESYFPRETIKNELIKESTSQANPKATKKFFKPVFGLDEKEINNARKSLLNYL